MIGYDLGGAVATGFAAKYPTLCASLVLVSPIGVKYHDLKNEDLFKKGVFGEFAMLRSKKKLVHAQEGEFLDLTLESPHRKLINKQKAMVQWQIDYTPGYLGTSTYIYK
jgi:pimeloyl-ACP methyl ester carboxylesterase